MPYPTALGQRPLEVREAYQALEQYAADYGGEALLLMMHASLPETLRPELLNLIRVNFLPDRSSDLSLEADVLFSPLSTAIGGGYYRIDPQVRWHCLALLRSHYRDDIRPRTRRVAELLWRYVASMEQRASRAADPQLAEFLDIQRWVALAFLEPASAAHAFADALRQTGDAPAAALLRLGGLTAAIEMPLANEQELLAYARGMEALSSGDEQRATELLEVLGNTEIRVGSVVLKAPTTLLAQWRQTPAAPGPVETEGQAARRKTCLVLTGFGKQISQHTGRELDLDRSYEMIREAVVGLDMDCLRTNEAASADAAPGAIYERLLAADLVVCDLSSHLVGVAYLLGICWALRPTGTLIISGDDVPFFSNLDLGPLLPYNHQGDEIAPKERQRFIDNLRALITDADMMTSPVYRHDGPSPPRQIPADAATAQMTSTDSGFPGRRKDLCLVIQVVGIKTDHSTGRALDLDACYEDIRETVAAAGLICQRFDAPLDSGEIDATTLYRSLHEAELVIADLSASGPEGLLALGIRFGLCRGRTIIVAEEQCRVPHQLDLLRILRYRHPGDDPDQSDGYRFRGELAERIKGVLATTLIDSPVYQALPTLQPPMRRPDPGQEDAQTASDTLPAAASPLAKVFVSYARDDLAYVRPLVEALAAAGVEVNWDMDLQAGENWQQALTAMLEGADVVIAVVSHRSLARPMAWEEIQLARGLGKHIIPVLVDSVEVPQQLATLACANRDEQGSILYLANLRGTDLDAAIARTAKNIRKALDALPANGPELRVITVRTHAGRELQFLWTEGARHDYRVSFQREIIDRLLKGIFDGSSVTAGLVETLSALLLPRELGALPPARNYRLRVAGEAAALPWELLLAYQQNKLRAPVPVLRLLDGAHRPPVTANTSRDALLVGDPQDRGFPEQERPNSTPPRGGEEELASFARPLETAGFEAVISYGEDAKTVIDRLFSRAYRILLISGSAVHAHRLPNKQTLTGFVLSDGVFLTVKEIEAMRIIPDLVVLHDRRAGHRGLTEQMVPQLLKAGVSCVLAPAWTVDERGSAVFLQRFFLTLANGARFEDACASARQAAFEAAPELSTWAAYQAWGDPDFMLAPQAEAA